MTSQADDRDAALQHKLQKLKEAYEGLREAKVRAEANLASLEEQLGRLESQAREQFGTADPLELERLLADKRAENERLAADYEAHLAELRQRLEAVERDGE